MKKTLQVFSFLFIMSVSLPCISSALSTVFLSDKGTGFSPVFPDVCKTPGMASTVPVPMPNTSISETSSGKIKFNAKQVAEKTSSKGETTKISIGYDVFLDTFESSYFSIFLADAKTGKPLGSEFELFLTKSLTGEVVFDLSKTQVADFEIIYVLSSEDTGVQLNSRFTITDMEFVGVSFTGASPPEAAPVPEPATLAMVALGIAGIGLMRRKNR